jgi:phage gp16-like protein
VNAQDTSQNIISEMEEEGTQHLRRDTRMVSQGAVCVARAVGVIRDSRRVVFNDLSRQERSWTWARKQRLSYLLQQVAFCGQSGYASKSPFHNHNAAERPLCTAGRKWLSARSHGRSGSR